MAPGRLVPPRRLPVSTPRLLPLRRACYHSPSSPPLPAPFTDGEAAILSSALAHVPVHGFTARSLVLGARSAGYLEASTNLFPRGAFDLVSYHLVTERLALRDRVPFPGDVGTGAKIRTLALARLMANAGAGIVGRWQEALAIMARPAYVAPSLRQLALLSDEIWYLAGDTDVSVSWYSKRASLAAVYASAELFMTTDTSDGFVETERFLDRRLEEVKEVGGLARDVIGWAGFTAGSAVNVLRSKGVRI